MSAQAGPIETDAVIVGAGPIGLFQVFQLGLQEIRAHVVDALPHAGGQCVELYPGKPIYDIPAIDVCTGQELTDRLLRQIAPFGAGFHLNQHVRSLQRQPDGCFAVATSQGTRFLAKTVFIAAGVGAFEARKPKVDGLAGFEGSQVLYRAPDATACAGQQVVILGDEDAALETAIALAEAARRPASVTLLHRRDSFRAAPALVDKMRALCAAGGMRLQLGQVTGIEQAGGRLVALQVLDAQSAMRRVPADLVLALLGLSPKLGPVADWGLAMERKQLKVDTEIFSTSEPGIFAVGDINTYPGKKKLILCGFHECVLAAFGAAAIVFPGKEIHLQYTTTSPRLHRLLGVPTPD